MNTNNGSERKFTDLKSEFLNHNGISMRNRMAFMDEY